MKLKKLSPISIPAIPSTTTSFHAATLISTYLEWGQKIRKASMTNGNYQQIEAYKNVIDWLNGRCRAFTDHTRKRQVKADWSNGKVATTGISYLGTMSNGLATTGVDGLEVIIAEAGISLGTTTTAKMAS